MATEHEVGERLHARGWRTVFTVRQQVDAWARLVAQVERGYDEPLSEYTNDLFCRNWLHQAWLLLDEHLVQLWTPRILDLDERFRAATVDDDGQALDPAAHFPPACWWWRRHPRVLTGGFGEELRAFGAIGVDPEDAYGP